MNIRMGRKLPPDFENYNAARDLAHWLCDRRIETIEKTIEGKMKKFLDENFLLGTDAARQLYHEYAKEMPVIDYHCHLSAAGDCSRSSVCQPDTGMAVWGSL